MKYKEWTRGNVAVSRDAAGAWWLSIKDEAGVYQDWPIEQKELGLIYLAVADAMMYLLSNAEGKDEPKYEMPKFCPRLKKELQDEQLKNPGLGFGFSPGGGGYGINACGRPMPCDIHSK